MYKPSILNVIENDYCIGCGVCATFSDEIDIKLNENGFYQTYFSEDAINNKKLLEETSNVCPFTDESLNEDEIGSEIFKESNYYSPYLGHYNDTYVGYVNEKDFREKGSSGGLGKWIAYELFRQEYVDKVIQVKQNVRNNVNDPLYSFAIYEDQDAIIEGSKSAYYPVEMSGILEYIKNTPGNYLITGVPCFIKSIRLLQLNDEIYSERIKYTIGLVCGHLKSVDYANMIGWQLGVHPDDISSLDFRKKIEGTVANQKGVEVQSIKDSEFRKDDIVQNIFGTNYGHGFFKYKACDYCDDVVSETADVTVGDAWLPEYIEDGKGNNVLIIRNELISKLVSKAAEEGRLNIETVSSETIIKSQDGGFRHRRQGLAYRLYLMDQEKKWRPQKRVRPSKKTLNREYKKIHQVRIRVRDQSGIQFKKARLSNDYSQFHNVMTEEIKKFKRPGWKVLASKIKQKIT